ncbi:MAG TPA: hypothetical protein V6C63_07670 [Allocoleopsis sp.]
MSKKWVAKKKTVNLAEKTVQALDFLANKTGYTESRIINDAIVDQAKAQGFVG